MVYYKTSETMKYILTFFILFWTVLLSAQIDISKEECKTQFDSISNQMVYTLADNLPEFPGGIDSMKRFIANNLIWPDDGANFNGTVFVSVIVESNGSLSNLRIARGIYEHADTEALRIIGKMPKWNPGKCNGEIVPVKYCIPVLFDLGY